MRSKSTRAVKSLKKSVAAHKSVFAHSTAVSLSPPKQEFDISGVRTNECLGTLCLISKFERRAMVGHSAC